MPQTVLCRFCAKPGERAEEDIIPKWLARRLQKNSTDRWYPGSLVVDEAGRREQQHRPRQTAASWKLDGVCKKCNGGWMNDIEDEARRSLWELIQGHETHLSPANLIEVARWAQLKWLCGDALHGTPLITPERTHAFAQARQPFDDTLVDLASYRSATDPFADFVSATRSVEVTLHRDGVAVDHCELVQVTIRVRHLVLRIVGPATLRDPIGELGPPLPKFVRCWPPDRPGNLIWQAAEPLRPAELRSVLFGRPQAAR